MYFGDVQEKENRPWESESMIFKKREGEFFLFNSYTKNR